MTDTKDLIREIQEHTAAHGGENTATHLLVQAVMALQRQADEMAAIGAGGVSGPLLGGAALAAPQQEVPAAEWLEQAYREGWAACRDAETIGEEAEDWAFGNSTANSRMIDMQQAAPQQEVQAVDDLAKELDAVREALQWYMRRCDHLQRAQHRMRDPERTMVCDILANGSLLVPEGQRYTAQPAPTQEVQAPTAWLEYARKKPALRRLVFTKTPDKELRVAGWVAEPLSLPQPAPSGDASLPPSYLGSVLGCSLHGNSVTFNFGDRDEAERWHDAVADAWDAARKEGK